MGRSRNVKTLEEQCKYNERRREQNHLVQQHHKQGPAVLTQDTKHMRQARQGPAVLAQDAERMRQARQDLAFAAREAEHKWQARWDDKECGQAENAVEPRRTDRVRFGLGHKCS